MDFPYTPDEIAALSDCTLCPRNCHANRVSGKAGYCGNDASFNISSVCIHHGEEPPVSGQEGICNIFFTGCNMQCLFCQNYQISSRKISRPEKEKTLPDIQDEIRVILDKGIQRVGFVSPSHAVPQMKAITRGLHSRGYRPVIVYNTNGYDKVETLKSLEGIVDLYLPDFKYMDEELAASCSDTGDYPSVASAALREMYRQKGAALHLDDSGNALSGIIIRHLVLPGNVQNSLNVLRFIAGEISPKMHISLMSQYYPTPMVKCHSKLNRTLTVQEYRAVTEEMEMLGLVNGWTQELDSSSLYQPDFDRPDPFA